MAQEVEYKIRITYRTGDSLGSNQAEDDVPLTWKDIKVAKQALAWIKQLDEITWRHKNSYTCRLSYGEKEAELRKLPCGCQEYPTVAMMLPRDDGTLRQIATFWRGYFERLIRAEIVTEADQDMVYEP
jgi:hypothetical protein